MTRWVTRRDMLRMSAAASLASLTGFGRQAFAAQSPLYWPGPTAWETREPAEVAMSAEGVADALAYAGAHNSTGVVVLRGESQMDEELAVPERARRNVKFTTPRR